MKQNCWSGFAWVACLVDNGTNVRVVTPAAGNWTYPPGGETLPDWSLVNNTTFTLRAVGYNFALVPEIFEDGSMLASAPTVYG